MLHVAIVGNSAAGLSALEALRARDRAARVTLVSAEEGPAYSRVLLPYFLGGKIREQGLRIRSAGFYEAHGAETLFAMPVEGIDVAARRLEFAGGRRLGFDRLLLATGASPVRPPIPGLDGPQVHSLWTLGDALRLDALLRPGARVLVLGAGFVALQAASAAARREAHVTVVEIADQVLPRVLDVPAARLVRAQMEAHGVVVHTATRTESVERSRVGELRVHAGGLEPIAVDVIVVGAGIRPNDGLLSQAVSADGPGFFVDAAMGTVVDGVFAAGDVARAPVLDGGPPQVHGLWPAAIEQGRVAGANLVGGDAVYPGSLSMNVCEVFGLTVASLGRVVEEPGDDVELVPNLEGLRYLKLVRRAGIPVGAVAVGSPQAAVLLGRVRPFVRRRRPLPGLTELLESRDLAELLDVRGIAEDARRVMRKANQEEAACALSS